MNQPKLRLIRSKIGGCSSFDALCREFPDVNPSELSALWDVRNTYNVQSLRAMTGLSQARFSERYGFSQRSVESWEGGQRSIPDYLLDFLAADIISSVKGQD